MGNGCTWFHNATSLVVARACMRRPRAVAGWSGGNTTASTGAVGAASGGQKERNVAQGGGTQVVARSQPNADAVAGVEQVPQHLGRVDEGGVHHGVWSLP